MTLAQYLNDLRVATLAARARLNCPHIGTCAAQGPAIGWKNGCSVQVLIPDGGRVVCIELGSRPTIDEAVAFLDAMTLGELLAPMRAHATKPVVAREIARLEVAK